MSRIEPKDRFLRGQSIVPRFGRLLLAAALPILAWSYAEFASIRANGNQRDRPVGALKWPVVMTQVLPIAEPSDSRSTGRTLRTAWGDGAKLLLVEPDGTTRRLVGSFHSACDPDVSFDGKRILFAGRPTADDSWGIYELTLDRSTVRRVIETDGECRSPRYLSTLYTIVSDQPWYQVLFVMSHDKSRRKSSGNELYSCKLDGSELTRLTNTLSVTANPVLMPDGRVLFASWQSNDPMTIDRGRVGLFAMNLDGTDYATFAGNQGQRIQHMPCVTSGGLLVCVEAADAEQDGSGMLGSVSMRRPLHSYRPITTADEGQFHSPSPLPDGSILVSWRPDALGQRETGRTHGVYRFDLPTHEKTAVHDDPRYDEIQAQAVRPREEPEGRSSVVRASDPYGEFYCLDAYTSDQEIPPGSAKWVRAIEGRVADTSNSEESAALPKIARHVLGKVPVESDGSFRMKVPANTAIQLQLLDAHGETIRSCRWIWARNREPRGCIGCHEDGERTPENAFVEAMKQPSVLLKGVGGQDPPVPEEETPHD